MAKDYTTVWLLDGFVRIAAARNSLGIGPSNKAVPSLVLERGRQACSFGYLAWRCACDGGTRNSGRGAEDDDSGGKWVELERVV